jgi:hypothetical protein
MALDDRLRIFRPRDAAPLARELFRECFKSDFPVPRLHAGLSIPTPPENWRQYVAVYHWPDGDETVGFCNWIRHGEVYLEGGMCVRPNFYRRMPKDEYAEMRERGGLAQMMMEHAWRELTDCKAWFGYCGDGKALAVDLRFGYEKTRYPYLIVRWMREIAAAEREGLVDGIAAIGSF